MVTVDEAQYRALWESYFVPGTSVLRNRLGIDDHTRLQAAESDLVETRVLELREDLSALPASYDLDHLCAVHRYLFQDVYDWAGKTRDVGIEKGGEAFAPPGNIVQAASHAAMRTQELDLLRGLDRQTMCREAAYLYDYWNYAHPFREGNGRALREFFDQLLAESGHGLAWDLVDRETLYDACHEARADSRRDGLTAMFEMIIDDDPAYEPRAG